MISSMRIAVFLLLLTNLLLFAWTRGYLGGADNPDARRIEQQLAPERLNLVARGEPPPATRRSEHGEVAVRVADRGPEEKIAESCQRWSELSPADADRVEGLLVERFAGFQAKRRSLDELTGYWVFIPPLASREEANRKTVELQELGVKDYFIVPSSGSSPLAISLGTYRGEEAAKVRLEALRAKGVRSAKLGERRTQSGLVALELRGPAAEAEALQQAIRAVLPKASATSCVASSEAARP